MPGRLTAARWSYLQGAYRDPHAARAALDELVKREGWSSSAARLAREPGQLGELRGKVGWFASGTAKQERANAERAAGALPGSLEHIGAAEAAIDAVCAAPDEKTHGEAWRTAQKDERVSAELGALRAAVAQRFGDEGVRHMLRAGGRPGAITAASITPEQRPALDRVAELTATLKQGERVAASLAQRQAESERQGRHRGLRI